MDGTGELNIMFRIDASRRLTQLTFCYVFYHNSTRSINTPVFNSFSPFLSTSSVSSTYLRLMTPSYTHPSLSLFRFSVKYGARIQNWGWDWNPPHTPRQTEYLSRFGDPQNIQCSCIEVYQFYSDEHGLRRDRWRIGQVEGVDSDWWCLYWDKSPRAMYVNCLIHHDCFQFGTNNTVCF